MCKSQILNRGFIVSASIAGLMFMLAVGTAYSDAERAEMTVEGASGFREASAFISLGASAVSLLAVFLGIGAFIQRMKDQVDRLATLSGTVTKMNEKTDQALQEFHQKCEVYRGAQAANLSGVKDAFALSLNNAAEGVRLELHQALERMWAKYDDLEAKHNANKERLIVLETKTKS